MVLSMYALDPLVVNGKLVPFHVSPVKVPYSAVAPL
jgi:hypothetical protein